MNSINSRSQTLHKITSTACVDEFGQSVMSTLHLVGYDSEALITPEYLENDKSFTLGAIYHLIQSAKKLDVNKKHSQLFNDLEAKYYALESYHRDHFFNLPLFIEQSTRDFADKDVVLWAGSVYYIVEHQGELLAFESGELDTGIRNFKNNFQNETAYFLGTSTLGEYI